MQEYLQRNRLYWLIAAIVILVLMVVWFMTSLMRISEPQGRSTIKVNVPTSSSDNLVQMTRENTSQLYIDGVENKNHLQARAAQSRGVSHVDRLVEGLEVLESNSNPDIEELKRQFKEMRDSQLSIQEQLRRLSARRTQLTSSNKFTLPFYTAQTNVEHMSENFKKIEGEAMSNAFDQIMTQSTQTNTGFIVNAGLVKEVDSRSGYSQERLKSGRNAKQEATIKSPSIEVIPVGGELLHARLNLGLNTDIGGIASATIVGGRFHGTVVTAGSYSAKRRHLQINFNHFCTPQGVCGDIGAIAVDLQQGVAAIQGAYKGHYGIRFSGSVAASIMEGYGRAISSGIGNNSLIVDGRFITAQNQTVDNEQALKASALEAGATVGQFFRDFANRPPQVSKDVNELIGLYIISAGVASDKPRRSVMHQAIEGSEVGTKNG